jgi:hypothetical protein
MKYTVLAEIIVSNLSSYISIEIWSQMLTQVLHVDYIFYSWTYKELHKKKVKADMKTYKLFCKNCKIASSNWT